MIDLILSSLSMILGIITLIFLYPVLNSFTKGRIGTMANFTALFIIFLFLEEIFITINDLTKLEIFVYLMYVSSIIASILILIAVCKVISFGRTFGFARSKFEKEVELEANVEGFFTGKGLKLKKDMKVKK